MPDTPTNLTPSDETPSPPTLADKQIEQDYFIAGGLTVDNVAEAKETFHPYALDVSSGVETDGYKDLKKIKAFIERVKA